MSEELDRLEKYPDISFIENVSFADLKEQLINDYCKSYKELMGEEPVLALADPIRLILYACAVEIYQGYQYEDKAGKMGLLKYSTGDFLDNLAALKGVIRAEASEARTIVRFTLAGSLNRNAEIPIGTRLKGMELYFETVEAGVIQAGNLYIDIPAKCQTKGTIGNGFAPGEISTLVDPLPYTLTIQNTKETYGGTDKETDEQLAERVYLAPVSYSTAGPEHAYEYWIRTHNTAIGECKIISESPGEVDIYITVDGKIPNEETIEDLRVYLSNNSIRPLTDNVIVKKPTAIKYEIEFIYYIDHKDRDKEQTIQKEVEIACQNYIHWQSKIGKDITPSKLTYYIMEAGAQSVEIKSPEYIIIKDYEIGVAGTPTITYGGVRDG